MARVIIVERVPRRPASLGSARSAAVVIIPKERKGRGPATREEIATELHAIASLARQMRPLRNQNPESWHEDRDEVISRLDRLEYVIRHNQPLLK